MSATATKADANAVAQLVARLEPARLARRLEREQLPARNGARRLAARYDLDLVAFLNATDADELAALGAALKLPPAEPGVMRHKLWAWGAALERRALRAEDISADVQPSPTLVRGKLRLPARTNLTTARKSPRGVLPAARTARFAAATSLPREVPAPRDVPDVPAEPATLDELLARADALVGVRLGTRGRDKGWYGQRVADLLGLPRSSSPTPDWRGEVELKTLAVVRARGATWRIKDGPAISMRGVDARGKLRRVLWVIRIDEGEVSGAPVLSWFYQELEREVAHAFERARHLRPKGGAGTTARGWYLRRDFFEACGLLRSLNG